MTTRLIANKYREGKVKRTLKRELKVLEIVKGEANIAVEYATVRVGVRSNRVLVIQGNRLTSFRANSDEFFSQLLAASFNYLEAELVQCGKITVFAVCPRHPRIERNQLFYNGSS